MSERNAPDDELPEVVPKPNQAALRQLIAPIKSPAQQIGECIINALQQDNTVAVITTVVAGPDGSQSVVTAGLDPELLTEVQQLLFRAERQRVDEQPCMGFHCLVRTKDDDSKGKSDPK